MILSCLPPGDTNNSSKVTCQFRQLKQSGGANPTQPKSMPHLVWDGSKFWEGPLELFTSFTVEVTLIPESHAEFSYIPMNLDSLSTHLIVAFDDSRARTYSSKPKIHKILKCPDKSAMHKRHTIHTHQSWLNGNMPNCVCIRKACPDFTYLSHPWMI